MEEQDAVEVVLHAFRELPSFGIDDPSAEPVASTPRAVAARDAIAPTG